MLLGVTPCFALRSNFWQAQRSMKFWELNLGLLYASKNPTLYIIAPDPHIILLFSNSNILTIQSIFLIILKAGYIGKTSF